MKQILITALCFFGIISTMQAQIVDFLGGQTTTDCNYVLVKEAILSPTEAHFVCPEGNGSLASILFQNIVLNDGEKLVVYNGLTSASGTLLDMTGSVDPQPVSGIQIIATPANTDNGCLMVQCEVAPDLGEGTASFDAFVSCVPACATTVVLDIQNDGMPGLDSISICDGIANDISVTAYGWFGTDTINLTESIVSTQWSVGSNLYANFSEIPLDDYGHFDAYAIVEVAINGCTQTVIEPLHIFVAHNPIFYLSEQVDTVYLGESIDLTAHFDNVYPFETLTVFPGDNLTGSYTSTETLMLPDGTGVPFLGLFEVLEGGDAVFSSSTEFEICLNIEHSWMHDLEIWIECPNGQKCILQDQTFNGFCNLGIPIDDDGVNPTGGVGFTYCWNMQSPLGTFTEAFFAGNTISVNNLTTLPPGEYTPFESFELLNGCPIQGVWTLGIFDNWGSDNGFVFEWGMNFYDDAVVESSISSYAWAPNNDIQQFSADSATITVAPTQIGLQQYAFSAINNSGCTADTLVPVFVIPTINTSTLYACGSQTVNAPLDSTTFSAGQVMLQTICPTNPDSFVQLVLFPYADPSINNVIVYDGSTINSTVLFDLSQDGYVDTLNAPGVTVFATAANTDFGCLTIATAYPTYVEQDLWLADVTCKQACQFYTFNYANSEDGAPFTDNIVLVCPEETFSLDAVFDFQQNNILYEQLAETTSVTWFVAGDSVGIGNTIPFSFVPGQIYEISATAIDQNNCAASLENNLSVYAMPTFDVLYNTAPFLLGALTDSIVIQASLGSLQGSAQIAISEGDFTNFPGFDLPNISSLYWMSTSTGLITNISNDSAAYITVLPFATEFPLTIVVENELGCQMTFDFLPSVFVGDHSLPNNLYTIAPNPASTTTQILGLTAEVSIIWYDVLGHFVATRTLSPTDNVMDVSTWPSGVYMYSITDSDGKILSGRLIKK